MKRQSPTPGPAEPNRDLPFVFINTAMTADGKIAFANGRFTPFGSARDRAHLLELRTRADAVMTGANTVNTFPVNLGPGGPRYRRRRRQLGRAEYNLRIIVSGSGSIKSRAEIFNHKFSPVIVLTTKQMPPKKAEQLARLGAEIHICGETTIDFEAALRWLKRKWHVETLLCEGGGQLNEALIRVRLVDEIHLTVCPFLFGGSTAPTLADGIGRSCLADASRFQLQPLERTGDELYVVYRRGSC